MLNTYPAKMVALAFKIIFAVYVSTSFTEIKALPRGLRMFLEKIGFPLEDVIFDPEVTIPVQQNDESTPMQVLSDVPEYSGGVNISIDTSQRYLSESPCSLMPAAVKVPTEPGYLNHPSFVNLQRCSGGCPYQQNDHHCTVSAQTRISLIIYRIAPSHIVPTTVYMYNHTACACDCIKSESHCDLSKHTWDVASCSCLCTSNGSECNTTTQRWNAAPSSCECECKQAPSPCSGYGQAWDYTNCGCHCSQSHRNYCTNNNQDIDPQTCQCTDVTADVPFLRASKKSFRNL